MLHIFDFAREMNTLAVAFRLVLAVLCGGLIGIEREYKRRPAGFRTHILICLGAAMTPLRARDRAENLLTDIKKDLLNVVGGRKNTGSQAPQPPFFCLENGGPMLACRTNARSKALGQGDGTCRKGSIA